jgi:hypothetical protein
LATFSLGWGVTPLTLSHGGTGGYHATTAAKFGRGVPFKKLRRNMNSTEVVARIMKHLCDIGGASIGMDNGLGIHIFNNEELGLYVWLGTDNTFYTGGGDWAEQLYTEEHLNLFLECSRIFVKQYTGHDVEDYERDIFTEAQDAEYEKWLPKLYAVKVRQQPMNAHWARNRPAWLEPHFENI